MAYQKKDVSFKGILHFKPEVSGRPCPFFIPPAVVFPQNDDDFKPYRVTNFSVFRKILMGHKRGQLLKICSDLGIATSQKPNKMDLINDIFGVCFMPRSYHFGDTPIKDMTISQLDDLEKIFLGKVNEEMLKMTPQQIKNLNKAAERMKQQLGKEGRNAMNELTVNELYMLNDLFEEILEEEEDISEDEVYSILDALDLEDDEWKVSVETFAEGYGGFTDATTVKVLDGAHGKVLFMVGGLNKATHTGLDLKNMIEKKLNDNLLNELMRKNPEIVVEYREMYDIYLFDGMRQVQDNIKLGFNLSSVSIALKLKGGGIPVKKKEKLSIIDSKFREKKVKVVSSLDKYIKVAQNLRDDNAEDLVSKAIEIADEDTLNMMLVCYNEGSTHGGRFAHEFARHVVPEIEEVEKQIANLQNACDMMKSAFEYKFSQEFMNDTGRFGIASFMPKMFEDRAKEIENEKKREDLMESEIEARVQQRLAESMAKMNLNRDGDSNMR
eukprot:s464_g32.t1